MGVKDKIKQWLFKDEIDRMKKLEELYYRNIDPAVNHLNYASMKYKEANCKFDEAVEICDDLRKTINDVCDVGVDVELHTPYHNWAVICVHGATEFVKFVPIKQNDIHTIQKFLKQFEYCDDRLRVDSPLSYKENCMPWISRHSSW